MSRIKRTRIISGKLSVLGLCYFRTNFYFIIASCLLFILHWKLALVSLSLMPLIGFFAYKFERKAGETYEKISDQGQF